MQHQIPAGYDFAPKADGFALTTDMSDSSSRPLSTSMSGKTQTVGPYGQDFINALMNDDVRLSKTMSLDQSSMNYELLAASGENTFDPEAYGGLGQQAMQNDISAIITRTENLPGYVSSTAYNLAVHLQQMTQTRIKRVVLTAPVACGNLIAVATMDDSAEAKAHYLMLLDAKILNETMDNPIIHVLQIPTYVRDLAFVNESTIVCAVGGGDIHVYIIDPETRAMTLFQGMGGIHSNDIRQLAVNGFETHIVATAGNDKNLVVTDLKANVITFRVPHDTGLNGVKFNQYSASMSVITDNGVVLLYDARAKYEKPQFIYNSRLPHLYSHEYVNDHSVLIGFGDGAMHHIDMRSPKEPVWRTNDPYATGIGRIKYNPRANAFVTSGYTDFSVYRHHCEPGRNNSAEIWSHSLPIREKSIESKLLSSFDADFFDDTTIMTTNSDGYLAMYKQDFTVYD